MDKVELRLELLKVVPQHRGASEMVSAAKILEDYVSAGSDKPCKKVLDDAAKERGVTGQTSKKVPKNKT